MQKRVLINQYLGLSKFYQAGIYRAAVPAVKEVNTDIYISHIDSSADWCTGIAFVNTEESAASVTLTAYNDAGALVATQVLTVGGHAKVVNPVESIFTQDISSATYIAYSSDRNVVGFQLNGSSDGMMLDGLPGIGTEPSPGTGVVIVPAGSFQMANSNDGVGDAIPVQTLTVSAINLVRTACVGANRCEHELNQ
jgi:hypothetical protein